jgi:hypothetical protein
MRRSYVETVAIVLVSLLALAACSTTSTSVSTSAAPAHSTSKTSAVAAVAPASTATVATGHTACASLARINQKLGSLLTAGANTTVGEVKAIQQRVTNTLNSIQARIPASSGALLTQVRTANAQLTAQLQGYSDTTPISKTPVSPTKLKAAVLYAQSRVTQLGASLKCAPAGTPMPTP